MRRRRRINEEAYPLNIGSLNDVNSILNNFGYTYELLSFNGSMQKGNDNTIHTKIRAPYNIGDYVNGEDEKGRNRNGQILSVDFDSDGTPISVDIMDSRDKSVHTLDYTTLRGRSNIYENNMNNKYNELVNGISKCVRLALLESVRSNGGVRKPLPRQLLVTNVEMEQPIFSNPQFINWYQNFVCLGGGCYTKRVMGMESHTFICNTKESARALFSMMKKNFIDRKIYVEDDSQFDEIMSLV